MDSTQLLDAVADQCRQAKRILFITGAGLSADSGLPTYRGIGGLYGNRLTRHGVSIEEALSGAMMARRPEVSWAYLAQIEASCRGAQPNAAHNQNTVPVNRQAKEGNGRCRGHLVCCQMVAKQHDQPHRPKYDN